MSVLSQEKKYFQDIKRSYFNNQLCNRSKIRLKIFTHCDYKRADSFPLYTKAAKSKEFGEMQAHYGEKCKYLSLPVRAAELTSSFLYLTCTSLLGPSFQ